MHTRVYISKNQIKKCVLFHCSEYVFSNFYPAGFSAEILFSENPKILNFNCSEQYFMYRKAVLVGDEKIAQNILEEQDPKEQKKLGRRLEMTEEQLKRWSEISREVMYHACLAKFSQNETCRKMMFNSHGMRLVEASPMDKIWGIGLDKMDKRCEDEKSWRGSNWLCLKMKILYQNFGI